MATVICNFYNEEYLLPWWLGHHKQIFSHGIMIDQGSNDRSREIIQREVPTWEVVESRLSNFDAWLNDLELMKAEKRTHGWKITLGVTEFLVPTRRLDEITKLLDNSCINAISCKGMLSVDHDADVELDPGKLLLFQKPFAIQESILRNDQHKKLELGNEPKRNRLLHKNYTGEYLPGRHKSFNPNAWNNSEKILNDIFVFHLSWCPMNDAFLSRLEGINDRIPESDVERGWGWHHKSAMYRKKRTFFDAQENSVNTLNNKTIGPALKALNQNFCAC